MGRWIVVLALLGCSGGEAAEPRTERRTREPEVARASDDVPPIPAPAVEVEATARPSAVSLRFLWPTPSEAEVRLVSEHDFSGAAVSASYRYRMTVTRDGEAYRIARTDLALESHEGRERLRLGNVIAQDVIQAGGELRVDADAAHITAISGFDPIATSARTALASASIDGDFAEAILALDENGWHDLAVVDVDAMVHEWQGRTMTLGAVEHAEALPGVEATRSLRAVDVACGENGPTTCVELVRAEQGVTAHGHLEHVYTLVTDPSTLRPYRFEHEARTVDAHRALDYAERWITTFVWD